MNEVLIKKAKKGNWKAYLELVLPKKDLLYFKALSLLRNEHDAADAVEEAMLKGYDSIKGLKEPKYFQTWLVRILINACIDIQRKAQKTVYLERVWEEKEISSTEATEIRLDLQNQLNQMDFTHRTVLILRYYEDMKVEEIAEVLGVPAGTVKSRIFNGLKKLKIQLKEAQGNEM